MTRYTLMGLACLVAGSASHGALLAASPSTQARLLARSHAISRLRERGEAQHLEKVSGPGAEGLTGAVRLYPYQEDAIYLLSTAPEEVSDVALQPGEALVSVASGDTARWVIGDTSSGSGSNRRVHVLVKPLAAGLSTNLLIATDRRVYRLALKSGAKTGMTSIAWSYADDPLVALKPPPPAQQATPVASALAVEELDFNYRIEGDRAPWRPLRAFDDGKQVFIEFPPDLARGEAPPLFIIGTDGKAELTNYRLSGRYYVVDQLFGAAELRLGEKHQRVVRILHEGSRRWGKVS